MGANPTKANENIYFRCRKAAAKYNDRLNSREGAAELLGVSPSSVADYELGITKFIPADVVIRMADLYGSPELLNYYCRHECPMGAACVPDLKLEELDRATIKLLAAFQRGDDIHKILIDITADGKITEEERPLLDQVLARLDDISKAAGELRLWAEKNLKGGVARGEHNEESS